MSGYSGFWEGWWEGPRSMFETWAAQDGHKPGTLDVELYFDAGTNVHAALSWLTRGAQRRLKPSSGPSAKKSLRLNLSPWGVRYTGMQ